ncbi:TonB-dependent siderophore receptor [Ideonella sp.]|uniref:TonB-dependent siderophore receptor n=1 Tax=Ideonella sp. TaxID=1929293 RepID=UPI0035B0C309
MALQTRSRFRSSLPVPGPSGRSRPWAITALALAAAQAALAAEPNTAEPDTAEPAASATERITVTGRAEPAAAGVTGFGDLPLSRSPFQVAGIGNGAIADRGLTGLSGLTRVDASVADAYNAPGYWSNLTVRGFVLNSAYNYRRDGLPISAQTVIALENKDRIEVLKGTSGAQAGTSAPGGLANLVVKRPRGIDRSTVFLGWTEQASWKIAADVERRVGDSDALAWRLNAAYESLDPLLENAEGERHLVALAGQARLAAGRLLEAEVELSHQSQRSMAGFSLLGERLPSAGSVSPRLNLNNQPWAQPVVNDGTTASLRWTEPLDADWQLVAQALGQRLDMDDRMAFPYGCSAEERWDRYCSDGTVDYYDYRSDGERRDTLAGSVALEGRMRWAGMTHTLSLGALHSDFHQHDNTQIYQWAGVGTVDGRTVIEAPEPEPYLNAGRRERSTELHLRDHVALSADTGLWLGLRHTRLDRGYDQSFTTPFVALSHQWHPALMVYGSWGQGVESEVVPDLAAKYTNHGEVLPALRSRQAELGLKWRERDGALGLTAFDIRRPATEDVGCDADGANCTRRTDGDWRHRGVEADGEWRLGAFGVQGSVMWLRARREGASDGGANGLQPTNVPSRSARLLATWQVAALPGLQAQAGVSHESEREVLPDNSITLPAWTRLDASLRYTQRLGGREAIWRAGVDNLTDRRAWRESPYQFGHAYLYPLEPRTFRISLQVGL